MALDQVYCLDVQAVRRNWCRYSGTEAGAKLMAMLITILSL